MSSPTPHRFAAYKSALQAISTRTGTPLPSLVLSFAVLHEITAIAPLIGGFYTARALGIGERVVSYVADRGEQKAERIGRRYELFGYEKGLTTERLNIAGDIANFVVAYGATKALLPVRVGLSLYLSPAFSRRVVEPIRKVLISPFRR
ncbi:hypothetical protein BDZ89DRAFT_1064061 [Hymenopellis radicata]|nr:hypothetical protein BDZ89DRAFT_1064061 [Hymenopellis radicata]